MTFTRYLTILAIFAASHLTAQNITITASLDSAYIIMGKQTNMHVEIIEDNNVSGFSPLFAETADTIISQVEIIKHLAPDTVDIGNNRRQINRDFVIQSFDSGLYTIPPIAYIAAGETILSNPLVLKVIPVSVDSMATIHGQASIIEPNTRWYDYLPDFITDYWGWILLCLFIIAGAVLAYIFVKKDVAVPLMPRKKIIPPYELAKMQLQNLKEEKLCEKGMEKEFYTRLTDILRSYINSRFGINAMEMTSSQIVEALSRNDETREYNKLIQDLLEISDFVKFAKVRPLPEDNQKSFSWALQFVEATKPCLTTEEQQEETNNKD